MSYGTPPPPPGYGAPMYGAPPPNHPKATTVLVLGILSLVVCGFLGIPAWIIGNRTLREIDASNGAVGGRSTVQTGRICGIVATILMALAVLFLSGLLVLGLALSTSVGTQTG